MFVLVPAAGCTALATQLFYAMLRPIGHRVPYGNLALNSVGQGSVVPAPGGVLIRDQDGNVLGAVGISGDLSDVDEQCAISAIEALGLRADAGVSA